MDDIPDFLKAAGSGPRLNLTPEGKPPHKPVRETFDFQPVVHAPAVRRSGTEWLDPPWLLAGTPREVQVEALRRSIKGFALVDGKDGVERFRILRQTRWGDPGFNYFMEMRLGKTYTILNDFMIQRHAGLVRWLVILVPNFLKVQWADEVQAMSDVPVLAFDSNKRRQAAEFISLNHRTGGIVVVNYEALVSPETSAMLAPIASATMFAADESIKLKNLAGVQSKAAIRLTKLAPRAVNASGKPVTQGPHDLLGQFHFGKQALNWMAKPFETHFAKKGGFRGTQVIGVKNEDELRQLMEPVSFIARFTDWYEGPGVEYRAPVHIDLTRDQKELIAQLEGQMLAEIGETVVTAEHIITRNMKQQQVRSGFIFDNDGKVHVITPPDKNPLLQEMLRLLEEEITTKVIIVGYYKPTMDMLEEAFKRYNPAIIRGADWHKTTGRDIESEKRRFNTDPGTRVLIGQETALSYGHTLMGAADDPATVMMFFEQSASLNERSQVEKRPQGVGQKVPILMLDFYASALDRRRVEALQRKEDVASVILGFARDQGILPRGDIPQSV